MIENIPLCAREKFDFIYCKQKSNYEGRFEIAD
jgi:hypothetical protein